MAVTLDSSSRRGIALSAVSLLTASLFFPTVSNGDDHRHQLKRITRVISPGIPQGVECWRYELITDPDLAEFRKRRCRDSITKNFRVCSRSETPQILEFTASTWSGGCHRALLQARGWYVPKPTHDNPRRVELLSNANLEVDASTNFVTLYMNPDKSSQSKKQEPSKPRAENPKDRGKTTLASGPEPTTSLRVYPLPLAHEDRKIVVRLGTTKKPSLELSGTIAGGQRALDLVLLPEHLVQIPKLDWIEVRFPDNSEIRQNLPKQLEITDQGFRLTLRRTEKKIEIRDAISRNRIREWAATTTSPRIQACQMTRTTSSLFYTQGCPTTVRIRKEDYESTDVDLSEKKSMFLLYPKEISARVHLPADIPRFLIPTMSIDDRKHRLSPKTEILLPGRVVRKALEESHELDIEVMELDSKAVLELTDGQLWILPTAQSNVVAFSSPCNISTDATVDVRLAGMTLARRVLPDRVPFFRQLPHELTVTHNDYETKKLNHLGSDTALEILLRPRELSRRFRVTKGSACASQLSPTWSAVLQIDGAPIALRRDGTFEATRSSQDASATITLGEATALNYRFRLGDQLSSRLQIGDWYKDGVVCDTQEIQLVETSLERRFRFKKIDHCSGNELGPISNLGITVAENLYTSEAGEISITRSVDETKTPIRAVHEQPLRFVSDQGRNARLREQVRIDRWYRGAESCDTHTFYMREEPRPGPQEIPLLSFSATPLEIPNNLSLTVHDVCGRSTLLSMADLELRDNGLYLTSRGYDTFDSRVEVSSTADPHFEPLAKTSLSLYEPTMPPQLQRRYPGVLVMVSATSRLAEAYPDIVPSLSSFLAEEFRRHDKVSVVHAFGRDLYETMTLPARPGRAEIRTAMERVFIDTESVPYPLEDLEEARRRLEAYNQDISNYRNRLIYIIPSDPFCRLVRPESVQPYLDDMEILVLEIMPEWRYRRGVCLQGIHGIRHEYIDTSQLLERLNLGAQGWRDKSAQTR